VLVTVIVAPGMTAPLGSLSVPEIVPVVAAHMNAQHVANKIKHFFME
jgi:hypothetical protein